MIKPDRFEYITWVILFWLSLLGLVNYTLAHNIGDSIPPWRPFMSGMLLVSSLVLMRRAKERLR